ncbi:MAG: pyridoxamine 5'-phosphate oxidase family protein [Cetobacterium sp.]
MFNEQITKLFQGIGEAKKAVLSTSSNNRVTSRMMSFVIYERKFYCQTDKRFLKIEQISNNPKVSICIDNIQIEGIAQILGKPLENKNFIVLFKKHFKNSYENYSFLENEILLEITPTFISVWNYKEGIPIREYYNLTSKEYKEEIYIGDE